jgi:hypothetical protein
MGFYFCPSAGLAQTWMQTGAPAETWRSIACSSDGVRLIAAGDEGVYGSLDGGLTWLFLNPTASVSVACTADGTKIIAAGSGAVYTSPDSGATWQPHALTLDDQYYVASSTDGSHLIAVSLFDQSPQNSGVIWRSTNSGVNWNKDTLTGYFSSAATSADGTLLAVADVARDGIYTLGEPGATAPDVLPDLSVATAGGQLSLRWAVSNAAGFLPFSTTNLAPPTIWSQVTNLPTLGSNQIQVMLPCSSQNQFFRLSQP